MNTLEKISDKTKISVDIPNSLLKRLDNCRGNITRTTWITGAIMEKLANVEKDLQK